VGESGCCAQCCAACGRAKETGVGVRTVRVIHSTCGEANLALSGRRASEVVRRQD
jgi:hypothetical protein